MVDILRAHQLINTASFFSTIPCTWKIVEVLRGHQLIHTHSSFIAIPCIFRIVKVLRVYQLIHTCSIFIAIPRVWRICGGSQSSSVDTSMFILHSDFSIWRTVKVLRVHLLEHVNVSLQVFTSAACLTLSDIISGQQALEFFIVPETGRRWFGDRLLSK